MPTRPRPGPTQDRDDTWLPVEDRPPPSRAGGTFLPRHVPRAALVVLAVLVVAEALVRVGARHLPTPQVWPTPESQHKADQIAALAGGGFRADVVIGGASMADAAVDPGGLSRELSAGGAGAPTVYNAALAGTAIEALAAWTQFFVVARLHPRVVVLGLSSVELNPNIVGTGAATQRFIASRPMRAAMHDERPLDIADRWAAAVSYLYRYRTVLRHPLASTHPPPRVGLQALLDPPLSAHGQALTFSNVGYLRYLGTPFTHTQMRDLFEGGLLYHFTIGPGKVRAIRSLAEALEARGIRVVVVSLPVTGDFVSFHPEGQTDYRRAVEALRQAAGTSGATFVDAGVWDTRWFADPVHLNRSGSERLTTFLSAVLRPLMGASG